MERSEKIRVMIVDDSSLMREAIRSIIENDGKFEVIALATDGKEAVEKAKTLKPDIITMDLKMPMMSGLEAIEKIMEENPIPIIVVSSLDVEIIIKALSLGAMDFVSVSQDIELIANELTEKLMIASRIKPLRRIKIKHVCIEIPSVRSNNKKIVTIGISTGGPQALVNIICKLPKDFPVPIVIVQHMSKGFIQGLCEWICTCSKLTVKVASQDEIMKPSVIYLAPDDYNMKVNRYGRIVLAEDVGHCMLHVPSIDVLMGSVADSFGKDSIGIIMTGMGSDGVAGIKAIKNAGGITIAQDESSSVVFGMNKAAIESGCVDYVLPLDKIAEELLRIV